MSSREAFGRIVRVLRVTWLTLGVVLLLLLGFEIAYRAQAALRRAAQGGSGNGSGLSPAFVAEATSEGRVGWRPYVYYRRLPQQGTWVNVDSMSHRRTVPAPAAGPHRSVFVFGASAVWGTALPDSETIPSRLARAFQSHGVTDIEVVNFGESGYVFTQEVIELMLQLRQGARPAAVVFYNGHNDVGSTLNNRYTGVTWNESDRARDFYLGQRLFNWRPDVGADLRAARSLAGVALGRVQLLARLRSHPVRVNHMPDEAIADSVVRVYAGNVGVVEALAARYGFSAWYAWMPVLDSVTKPLSARERTMFEQSQQSPANQRYLNVYRLARARVAGPVSEAAPGHFVDLLPVFATDSGTAFVDDQGHTTANGSDMVARELERVIEADFAAKACAGRPARAGSCLGGRR